MYIEKSELLFFGLLQHSDLISRQINAFLNRTRIVYGLHLVEQLHLVHVLFERVESGLSADLIGSSHMHAHAPAPELQLGRFLHDDLPELVVGPRQVAEQLASPPDKRVAVESLQSHLNRFRDTEREELWLVGRDCVYDRQLYVLY